MEANLETLLIVDEEPMRPARGPRDDPRAHSPKLS
jgi:hypothetical protein